MRLIAANNDTCLILEDTEMYAFLPSMGQWLLRPQTACWRSGLVIKHRVPEDIKTSFKLRITVRRLVCVMSHLKIMTSSSDVSGCGLVSGNYQICKLSGVAKPETGRLTTYIASSHLQEEQTQYMIYEIPNKFEGWTSASNDELESRISQSLCHVFT